MYQAVGEPDGKNRAVVSGPDWKEINRLGKRRRRGAPWIAVVASWTSWREAQAGMKYESKVDWAASQGAAKSVGVLEDIPPMYRCTVYGRVTECNRICYYDVWSALNVGVLFIILQHQFDTNT